MEYGYSGVDEKSKVLMLMNGTNTNTLNACKAAILAIPEMKGDFEITERRSLNFIAMIPYLQNNSTAKVAYVAGSVVEGDLGAEVTADTACLPSLIFRLT